MGKISEKEFIDILDSDALMGLKDGCYKNINTDSLIALIRENFTDNINLFYNGVVVKTDSPNSKVGWWFATEKGTYLNFANVSSDPESEIPVVTRIENLWDLAIISVDKDGKYQIKPVVGSFSDLFDAQTDAVLAQFSADFNTYKTVLNSDFIAYKVSTNAELNLFKKNIAGLALSGIKGVATQTNAPTVYTAETYPNGLTEIWKVFDPLTSPNSWGNIAVTQAELSANDIYFVVTNGVVAKKTSPKVQGRSVTSIAKTATVGEVDTYTITYSDATTTTFTITNGTNAKLPLYSAIKSANIAATTQFVDDENGNVVYRVKTGQTLLTTELPANVVGTKVERVGGADTSNLERKKPTNSAVALKTGTSLIYSDANVGNLGGSFAVSALLDFVQTVADFIQKGDPITNGWAITRKTTGLFFVVNGVETLITYNVLDFQSFITIIGDGTKTRIYGNGQLIFEQTGLVTTATEAIKVAPIVSTMNPAHLYYISINSAAISETDIKDELSKIVGIYSLNEIQRDFVGNFSNFTTAGAKKGDKNLSGTAILGQKTYPDWTLKEGSLISQKDISINKNYVSSTGSITNSTTASTSGFGTNKEVNIETYSTIRLVNASDYFQNYYKFLDKDRKIIKIDRISASGAPTVATVDITVPPFAVYFVGTFGKNAGIIGLVKKDLPKPALQKRLHKAQQDIELLAPCIYDGTFDLMSSQTPTTLKIFDVLSSTSTTMTIAEADWNLFPNNGIVMDLAVKSSTGNYYFIPVLKSATTGVLDVYQKTLDFTPAKFMAAHDTTTSSQGQHLSAYGSRALADGIIGSIQNPTSYRNNGSIGFVSNDGVTAFTKINTTDFLLHDDNGQEVFKGSGVAVVTSESTNDDAVYKGGFALGHVLNIRANVAGEIANFKTKAPFKNGFFEIIIENPIGTLVNSYVAVATANLVIENNGVEVYNAPIYTERYQKISVTKSDWDNITVKVISNSAANSCVFIKSMILFRAFAGQVYNPIVAETSTHPVSNKSIVAFFSDSWGEYPIASNIIEAGDDTTLLVRAFDGTNGAGYGYTPKRIAAKTSAEVDNWAYGGTTAVGQYKMMWDIMKKKRYTHIVVHFYLNDMTQNMTVRIWENALRAIVRTAIANGIQPIVVSPMASASDGQRRGAGQMAMSIRRGLYEAL